MVTAALHSVMLMKQTESERSVHYDKLGGRVQCSRLRRVRQLPKRNVYKTIPTSTITNGISTPSSERTAHLRGKLNAAEVVNAPSTLQIMPSAFVSWRL